MSAIEKEKIYVELRKYHLDEFPGSLSNPTMNKLLSEYRVVEDEVIAMLLGLVNGKSEFTDLSSNLEEFKKKVRSNTEGNKDEKADINHFALKIEQLEHILKLAKGASFTMKRPRKVRESTREVVTRLNKN